MTSVLVPSAWLFGALTVWLLLAFASAGCTDSALPALPEGNVGLAARYPGDRGIEKDPAVLFHDDFEGYRTAADLARKWSVVTHDGNMRLAEDHGNVNGGRRSLEFAVPMQREALSVEVGQYLAKAQEVLFLRFYSKFDPGFDVPRGSVHDGGSISSRYYPGGMATPGKRADGRNKFLANFETAIGGRRGAPSPGPLYIYLYHPEQRGDYGDQFFPTGVVRPNTSLAYDFGPHFVARPDFVPELGRWYCYEYMVKANTPGQRDGRIACWVDGKLIADFPNLRLRDTEELKIDRFGLCLYIADNRVRENKKWYDDVVAATAYIGPRATPRARSADGGRTPN